MAEGFSKIPRVQAGDVSLVSAEYANKLIDLLNNLGGGQISPIANVGTYKIGAAGAIWDFTALDGRLKKIEQAASTGALGGASVTANNLGFLPFGINDRSTNNNAALINVRYATVGAIVPAGIATDISVSANTTLYLNITIDNNATVTAASVNTGAVPSPNTSTKAYALIGNVVVASNVVTQIDQALLFSQTFVACNRNTSDPTTTPGTYYLQVS